MSSKIIGAVGGTAVKKRAGNIELLRVVSMLMVLALHVDGASVGLPGPDYFASYGVRSLEEIARDEWRLWVEAFSIVGVNCFTMISGYFGVRLRWRSVASYLFQCLFYSVGIFLMFALVKWAIDAHGFFTWRKFAESFMVLSHNNLWYVPAYFMLMLLAPFLNAAFAPRETDAAGVQGSMAVSSRTLLMAIGVFTAINLWCGWWWAGKFNPTGYTVIQLINVYMIARWIGYAKWHAGRWWQWACVYLISVAAIYVSARLMPGVKAFAYNSPFVMLASVALFMTFLHLRIDSRWVLRLASGAFAVYLIHKNPYVWIELMCPFVMRMWRQCTLLQFSLLMLGFVPAVYVVCSIIDLLRVRCYDIVSRSWQRS